MQLSPLCICVTQGKVSPNVSHLVCKLLYETKNDTARLLKVFTLREKLYLNFIG